ncbi:hypothetical protein PENTCL1PPCAC_1847 [Pristionchus entomophagus]|uniref:Uncharacterized protein n=1 Tax=Pristionchus entomophagus TaxID=358040 RepID=A0AAV5SAP1_9BILA|nr:hypothetical protein PENTCL1PPCAC_1847 [Pristionchus entomophagus]
MPVCIGFAPLWMRTAMESHWRLKKARSIPIHDCCPVLAIPLLFRSSLRHFVESFGRCLDLPPRLTLCVQV